MPTIQIPTYQRQVYKQDKTINPQVSGPYSKQLLDNPMNDSMQRAGEVVGKIAEYQQRQKLKDEENMFLDYENKLNGFYDDIMYNEKDGLMFKKGQDSANLVQQLKEKNFEYKDDKGNIVEIPESIKERVNLAKDRIFTQKLKQVASYQVQEQQRYKDQLVTANINNEISNCINNSFTAKSFDKIDSIIDNNYSQFGKDILDFKKRQVRDDFAKQRISLLLEVGDNTQAKHDLETIKNKISPQTYEKLKSAVRGGLISDYARNVFDELLADSVDDDGYVIENNINDKINNIKGEKFTPEEIENLKNLVINKCNHRKYEINQEKATRQNSFQNSVAKMIQEGGHSIDEYEKLAFSSGRTALDKQTNAKYVQNLFKENQGTDNIYIVNELNNGFASGTVGYEEIRNAFLDGDLKNSTFKSMSKKYFDKALGITDNYGKGVEIHNLIENIAENQQTNKITKEEIKYALTQKVANKSYDEALKIIIEQQKGTGLFGLGTPIYKKEIETKKENVEFLNKFGDMQGINKSKFVKLMQEGYKKNITTDDINQFIVQVVGTENIKNPESVEYKLIQDMITDEIPLTPEMFAEALSLAKKQMENK